MELVDQLGYEILALTFDGQAPLSVVLPEARSLITATKSVEVDAVTVWLTEASRQGWVVLSLVDYVGPDRPPTSQDLDAIAREYSEGLRPIDEISQTLDRPDLWIAITDGGERAVRAIWPQMPSDA